MTQRSETDIVNEHLERIARMPREVNPDPIDLDDLGSPRPLVWIFIAWLIAGAIALILWPGKARSAEPAAATPEVWLVANTATWHRDRFYTDEQGREQPVNQWNWGGGLEVRFTSDLLVTAGAYRNSYFRTSGYVLAGWQPLVAGPLRAGAALGVASGYQVECGHSVCLAGGAMISLQVDQVGLNVMVVPPLSEKTSGLVALQLKWRLL